jgi:glycosyltransferase involved in cell wall biosynthesis
MPKISIIVPAYINSADKVVWLGEALESVKRQSFTDWECIIIDDSSPNDISEVKVRFLTDSRFRWFKTSNNTGSPASVRNTAVALAESEAILPLDSDDQLGSDTALEQMYQSWYQDKKRVVYGNLQLYILENGSCIRKKVVALGDYTFERVIDPRGLFPVTALHSVACHLATGGWKPELDAGFEDLEYWIAAGERGYCGHWIKHTTLLYRRHQDSRFYHLRHGKDNNAPREPEMTTKIVNMHKDTYEGRYTVGCCGKGKATGVSNNGAGAGVFRVTTLDEVGADDKVWVKYQGNKTASFRIASDVTSPISEYIVQGTGHTFELHRSDIKRFQMFAETINGARQSAYVIGVPSPIEVTPEIQVVESTPPREPQLAEVERLDRIAMKSRGIEPEPVEQPIIEAVAQEAIIVERQLLNEQTYNLSELGLSPSLQSTLESENWTIEKLATAEAIELTPYKGIGAKRAKAIIEAAQRATNG